MTLLKPVLLITGLCAHVVAAADNQLNIKSETLLLKTTVQLRAALPVLRRKTAKKVNTARRKKLFEDVDSRRPKSSAVYTTPNLSPKLDSTTNTFQDQEY
jgi:hypothetical protein